MQAHGCHIKHVKQWQTNNLYVTLAGDIIPTTALTTGFYNKTHLLHSTTHKQKINTQSLLLFLTNDLDPEQFHSSYQIIHRRQNVVGD